MESTTFMIPKKGKTDWELISGYGKREAKYTAIGVAIGLVLLFIIVAIQSMFFPLKEVEFETLGYGSEYIESENEGMVLVDRSIPTIFKTLIVLTIGALVTFLNLRITSNGSYIEVTQLNKRFKKDQQRYLNERYKLF